MAYEAYFEVNNERVYHYNSELKLQIAQAIETNPETVNVGWFVEGEMSYTWKWDELSWREQLDCALQLGMSIKFFAPGKGKDVL